MNKPEQPNYVVMFFAFAFWVFCAVISAMIYAQDKITVENTTGLMIYFISCVFAIWWVSYEIKKWKAWRKYIKSRMGYKK